jgi:hypothetical protein
MLSPAMPTQAATRLLMPPQLPRILLPKQQTPPATLLAGQQNLAGLQQSG